jgi:hypothetical protein
MGSSYSPPAVARRAEARSPRLPWFWRGAGRWSSPGRPLPSCSRGYSPLTAPAWLSMSGWGGARRQDRRRNRGSSAPIATTSLERRDCSQGELSRLRSSSTADLAHAFRLLLFESRALTSSPAQCDDNAAVRRRLVGGREEPGSVRACQLVPGFLLPIDPCMPLCAHGRAATQPIWSRRIGSCSIKSSIGRDVVNEGRRSNGRSWPTAPRLDSTDQ